MQPTEHALLAVVAAHDGDATSALDHIARAHLCARTAARRERQIVEIAAAVVSGARDRAAGLALVHTADFPDDSELLAGFAPPPPSPGSDEPACR